MDVQALEPEPLDKAVTGAPEEKNYQDYLAAADKYVRQKDYRNALTEYGKAQKLLPDNDKRRIFIFEQEGQISVKLKNIHKAKEFYLAAIQTAKKLGVSDITVVNAYLGLAHCFEKSDNISPAIKNYEKALGLSTNDQTKLKVKKILKRLKAQAQ